MQHYFSLAFKNLKHRGLRSSLTLLGIVIGISAVVALISLGQGLQDAITGQFSSISADRLVVTNAETAFGPPGSTAIKKLNDHDIKVMGSVSGVERIIPRLIRVLKVEINSHADFIFTGSLPQEKEDLEFLYTTFNLQAEQGKLPDQEDSKVILAGSEIAQDFDLKIGKNLKIQGESFEVFGILKPTGNFQFNHAIFMPQSDMQDVLDIEDEYDLLIVKIDGPENSPLITQEIARKFRKDRGLKEGQEDFSVETPSQILSSINNILIAINIVISSIAGISLLIGAIGISNTMFTSVLERMKEIGIMKAVGAKNSDILKIFLIESSFLGLIGGILGAILGLLLAFFASKGANSFLNTNLLSISINWLLLILSILFALFLGTLSGIIPAIQASRLKPQEVLRK